MKNLISFLLTAIILISGCSEPSENPNLPAQNTKEALLQEEELLVETNEEKHLPETQKEELPAETDEETPEVQEEIEQESEKELKPLQEVETDEETLSNLIDLSSWLATYSYHEDDGNDWGPIRFNRGLMYYNLSIYEEEGFYFADFHVHGSMVDAEIKTYVLGDDDEIEIVFQRYLSSPATYFNLREGDLLFKLKKIGLEIYTEWCTIQPLIFPIENPNDLIGIYFIDNYFPLFINDKNQSIDKSHLSVEDAIALLKIYFKIHHDEEKYNFQFIKYIIYNGELSYKIRVFCNDDTFRSLEGYYLVTSETHETYRQYVA